MAQLPLQAVYAGLPERFSAPVAPTPVAAPRLIALNRSLAADLGLDPEWLASAEGVEVLAGNRAPPSARPIATAYAGHQFGQFVPQLGDGRAILLGELVDRHGVLRDVQLKGAGRTPFSRGGDGRSPLGPVLREFLMSESMAALGIPTTRALAAVTTGEAVRRETLLPGAVFTRVASSHIRVGTFQFFAARGDVEGVQTLAYHVISRHYPTVATAERPYHALLEAVVRAQAELVARWLLVGFVHGVMNTDNTSIAGETIDYGPCAFLDAYDPAAVFSSIDRLGRYAYASQPAIAEWNVSRLAECLLPLLADDADTAVAEAVEAIGHFAPTFEHAYQRGLRAKLGLLAERPGDIELASDLLTAMAANRADFTLTFRRLSDALEGDTAGDSEGDAEDTEEDAENTASGIHTLFDDPSALDEWLPRWRRRLQAEPMPTSERRALMLTVNPTVIPRNHRVEAAIRAAVEENDLAPFGALLDVLTRPFDPPRAAAHFAEPPGKDEPLFRTFCGT